MTTITRKKLQERFFGKQEVEELHQDISDVYFLFEELRQHVNYQTESISNIQETIIETTTSVKNSETDISLTDNVTNKVRHLYYAFFGGGISSIALLYNPYIGIGAISTGMIIGSLFSYFKK